MAERFAEIDADPEMRVVVSARDGEHFTSGGDIAGFMEVDPIDFTDLGHNVTAPSRSPKPVIAAIDGYCFGVGLRDGAVLRHPARHRAAPSSRCPR